MASELLLASSGDCVKIWNNLGASLVKQFNPHDGNLSTVAWSHDNSHLVSAQVSGKKVVLTAVKNNAYSTFDIAVDEQKTCAIFNSNSRYLLCGGKDGLCGIWDLKTKKLKKTYEGHKGAVNTVAFNSNDTHITTGGQSGEIIIFNVITGQSYNPMSTPKTQGIQQVKYSHYRKSLLGAISDDGALNLWDANSHRLIHSFEGAHRAPATGLCFSPINEMLLMSVGLDKRIICYDVQGKTCVKSMTAENPLTSIDILQDGVTMAVGSTRGKIYTYDLRQGNKPIQSIQAHKSSVQGLAFQSTLKFKSESNRTPRIGSTPTLEKTVPSSSKPPQRSQTANTAKGVNVTSYKSSVTTSHPPSTSNHGDVFSPIREAGLHAENGSENRPDVIGTDTYESKPNTYTDGVLSPLGENSSNTSNSSNRKLPIGGSIGLSPLLSSRDTASDRRLTARDTAADAADSMLTVRSGSSKIHEEIISPYTTQQNAINATLSPRQKKLETSPRQPPKQSPRDQADNTPRSTSNVQVSYTRNSQESSTAHIESHMQTTEHDVPPEGAVGGVETSLPQFQTQFIRNMIEDALDDFKDQIHKDISRLQMEMLRQFQIQQQELLHIVRDHSVNEELVAEIERLKAENNLLKKNF